MSSLFKSFAQKNGIPELGEILSLDDTTFWKGALTGAAAVLLLTNENVRETLFKGFFSIASATKKENNGNGNGNGNTNADNQSNPKDS